MSKVVDLRKERERREKERRSSSVEKPAQESGHEDVVDEDALKDIQRGGLFWETPEYEYHEKQQRIWIRNALIIAIPLVIIFILVKNILGVFLVLFGSVAFLLEAFRKPSTVEYGINERGVVVGGSVTPYEKLESFWIFPKEQGNMLSLVRKGKHGKRVSVTPLGATKKERLRDLERVSEEDDTLLPQRNGLFSQYLRLPLGDTDRDSVRNALMPHIEEKEQHPSVTDSWLRRIGY